jgi:hypothetical protein
VAEVSETTSKEGGSLKLKMHSKVQALEMLGKHLNLFGEAPTTTVLIHAAPGANVQVNATLPASGTETPALPAPELEAGTIDIAADEDLTESQLRTEYLPIAVRTRS